MFSNKVMTKSSHEEYREELILFLKTKVDDISECSRSLQVECCSYFKQHLSSNVFVSFCTPNLSSIITKSHVELTCDHKNKSLFLPLSQYVFFCDFSLVHPHDALHVDSVHNVHTGTRRRFNLLLGSMSVDPR